MLPLPCRLRLGDVGEQDVLRLLHRHARDGVAHAKVTQVQQRQHAADDEHHFPRQPHPLQEGIGVVGDVLQAAGFEVPGVDGLVEL